MTERSLKFNTGLDFPVESPARDLPGSPRSRDGAATAIAACAVAATGALVLAGWQFDLALLRLLSPGRLPMNPAAALAFVLAGFSLWTLGERSGHSRRGAGGYAALAVFLIGAVKVGGVLLGRDVGIDRILFSDRLVAFAGDLPNRMAPNAAGAFLLTGLALLLLHRGRRFFLAQALTLVPATIALIAVVGYAFGSKSLYGVPSYIPMAFITALAFFTLSFGIFAARRHEGFVRTVSMDNAGGATARRLLPAALFLPIALGWLRLAGQHRGLYPVEFGVSLMVVSSIVLFTFLVWWNARSVGRAESGRERAEQALLASERRLQLILDNAPAVISVKDAAGRYLFVNRGFERATGRMNKDVLGLTRDEIFPESVAKTYRAGVPKPGAEGAVEIEETIALAGGLRTFLSSRFPIRTPGEGADELGSISIDITDRKRAEEEVGRAERFLESIVENIPHMVFVKDAEELRFVRFNRAGEKLTGLARGDVLGKSDAELFSEEQAAFFVARDREVLAGREAVDIPGEPIATPHGDRLLHTRKIPICDSEGTPRYLLGISEDITERKRAEDEIRTLNAELNRGVEELKAVNGELEAFSYSVSHDLRAPLRHILGFADLLKRHLAGGLDEKSRHFLTTIIGSAARMSRLIEDLLAFSRTGRTPMRVVRVDLRPMVDEVLRELPETAAERQVEWKIGELPQVQADAPLLRQVLVNLLSNALKYTGPTPHARIEIGEVLPRNGETVFFVRDNGVGFDMRYAEKLFGVFQRLHRAEEFEGTGIGLANVRRIIHRHGGRTWAEGSVGQGATFYFSLPVASEEAA